MRHGGTLIFTRKRDLTEETVRLQDFEIKKMIGKGAFGKVFLVQHRVTQKVYAMKTIRKDVVLD